MKNILKALKELVGLGWDFSDRRRLLRFPCKFEAQVGQGDDLMVAEIRDLSISGLQVLCYGPIKKNQNIRVKCRNLQLEAEYDTVNCKVQWRDKEGTGFLVGASFTDPESLMRRSWVFFELKKLGMEASKAAQKRKGIRVVCLIPALLGVEGEVRKVKVKDLGLNGARIEAVGAPLKPGTTVKLGFGPIEKLPKIDADARVVAVRGRRVPQYGLEFTSFRSGNDAALQRYLDFFFVRG